MVWTEIAEMNTDYIPAKIVVNGYELTEENGYEFFDISISTDFTTDGFLTFGCACSATCSVTMSENEIIENGTEFQVLFEIENKWEDFGTFFASGEPEIKEGVISFSADGILAKRGDEIVQFPSSKQSFKISEIIEKLKAYGIIIELEAEPSWDFYNYGFIVPMVIQDNVWSAEYTVRELVSSLAFLYGGNAVERNGKVYLKYAGASGSTMTKAFDPDTYSDMVISRKRYAPTPLSLMYQPITIPDKNYIVYKDGDKKVSNLESEVLDEYDIGYNLQVECDIAGATLFNENGKQVQTYYGSLHAYRPFHATFIGYHPYLYSGAFISVNDENGEQYEVFCNSVTYNWDGGMSIDVSSSFEAQVGNNSVNQTSTTNSSVTGTMNSQQQGQYNAVQTFKSVYTNYVEATNALIGNIVSTMISTENLSAHVAEIDNLEATDALIKNIFSDKIISDSIVSNVLKANILDAEAIRAVTAEFGYITSDEADLKYATIDLANIENGSIKNAMIGEAEIGFEKVNKSFIKDLVADNVFVENLEADIAKFGYLTANEAALKYADITFSNIDTANINTEKVGLLFAEVGLLDRATIVEGHVTGFLDSVEINANKITAGTLIVDRLYIKGAHDKEKGDSILYKLNYDPRKESVSTSTLDGDVITDRTVTADKLVAHSITANEIDTENLFATKITATNMHITGDSEFNGLLMAEKGQIGGFSITSKYLIKTIEMGYVDCTVLINSDLNTVTFNDDTKIPAIEVRNTVQDASQETHGWYVTYDGYMHAEEGYIAGFNFNKFGLVAGKTRIDKDSISISGFPESETYAVITSNGFSIYGYNSAADYSGSVGLYYDNNKRLFALEQVYVGSSDNKFYIVCDNITSSNVVCHKISAEDGYYVIIEPENTIAADLSNYNIRLGKNEENHLNIGGNRIQAATNGSSASTLYLNYYGGDVSIGNDSGCKSITLGSSSTQTKVDGTLAITGDITGITHAITIAPTSNLSLVTSPKAFSGYKRIDSMSDSGYYSVTTDGLSIKKSGTYKVSAMFYVGTGFSVNDNVGCRILKNGSTIISAGLHRVSNAAANTTVSLPPVLVSLTAGQSLVPVCVNLTAARGTIVANDTATYMTVEKVS